MKQVWLALLALFATGLLAGACASSSAQTGPVAQAESQPTGTEEGSEDDVDCANYEHQLELCRPACEECSGDTPGNSCNVCVETCADMVFCEVCGVMEHCPRAE